MPTAIPCDPPDQGRGKNKMSQRAHLFRLDLFDPKSKRRRNSRAYFEDVSIEDRTKIA